MLFFLTLILFNKHSNPAEKKVAGFSRVSSKPSISFAKEKLGGLWLEMGNSVCTFHLFARALR